MPVDGLELKLDRFFTDTRVRLCIAMSCQFNRQGNCDLKEISLDGQACCRFFQPKGTRPPAEVIDGGIGLELETGPTVKDSQ
jgi:hypothetical protein